MEQWLTFHFVRLATLAKIKINSKIQLHNYALQLKDWLSIPTHEYEMHCVMIDQSYSLLQMS